MGILRGRERASDFAERAAPARALSLTRTAASVLAAQPSGD